MPETAALFRALAVSATARQLAGGRRGRPIPDATSRFRISGPLADCLVGDGIVAISPGAVERGADYGIERLAITRFRFLYLDHGDRLGGVRRCVAPPIPHGFVPAYRILDRLLEMRRVDSNIGPAVIGPCRDELTESAVRELAAFALPDRPIFEPPGSPVDVGRDHDLPLETAEPFRDVTLFQCGSARYWR